MDTTVLYIKIAGIALLIAYIRYRIQRFENDIVVHDTWQEHVVNFKISAKAFYCIIQQMIEQKRLPDVRIKQVALYEEGWPSRKRLYLRITHKAVIYFISVFAMGEDFFISCRMGFRPALIMGKKDEKTFYQTDSERAFVSSIHKIVLHSVEIVTKQYGTRELKLNDETGNN